MPFFAKYTATQAKLAEQRKQQLKGFGSWRALSYGFFILSTFGFFGMALNFITSTLLYGIPQYISFAVLATLIVHLSFHPSIQQRTKGEVTDTSATMVVIVTGIAYILVQMVMSYFNQYILEKELRFSSFEFVVAILLRHEVAGFVRTLCPTFEETAKAKSTIARLGILALSFTALVPLLSGWFMAHIITKLTPFLQLALFSYIGFTILLVLIGVIIKDIIANNGIIPTTSRMLNLTVALVAFMGITNGLITGSGPLEGDAFTTTSTVQVILYAILASEIMAALTLWFMLIVLPRYYGKTLPKGPIKAKKA